MNLRLYRADETIHAQGVDSSESAQTESLVDQSPSSDLNTLGQFIPLHYHYNMLQDEQRVGAFRSAIEATVRPGMHVVELGGGTGILSSFAAGRGASVTCVERNPELVRCATKLIELNGLSASIEVVHGDACEFIPNRPVDVVICEMMHVGFLREKQLQVIQAFKRNHGHAFGTRLPRFLPEATLLTFQPVQHAFDFFGYYAPVPLFQAPQSNAPSTFPLSSLISYGSVIYDEPFGEACGWSGPIQIEQSGQLSAFRFVTQNLIAINAGSPTPIEWPNQFLVLPLDSPIDVVAGEEIFVEFAYEAGGSIDSLASSIRTQTMHGASFRKAA
jgi:type I protein arginine methyltransferase